MNVVAGIGDPGSCSSALRHPPMPATAALVLAAASTATTRAAFLFALIADSRWRLEKDLRDLNIGG